MNKAKPSTQQDKIRSQLLHPRGKNSRIKQDGRPIAEIHRCAHCCAWWGSSRRDAPQTHEVIRLIQQQASSYSWVDYRGWRRAEDHQTCPACGQESAVPELSLHLDEQGNVQWPTPGADPQPQPNAFAAYIAESDSIVEHVDFITAREKQQKKYATAYTAEIDELRDEMNAMRNAFKNLLNRYAPILPPGWRVTGDYDKWLKGQACAGFLHGELSPDISLIIGGRCHTVADVEMEMDRLYGYVCELV